MHDFLYGFLTWFKAFFDNMLGGVLMVVKGIVLGIIKIFNLPYYFKIWADEAPNFGVFDWIFSILAFLLVLAVWAGVIFLAVLAVRKYIRFRRGIVGNEDLLEEIADLHRDVLRLTSEKERIMQLADEIIIIENGAIKTKGKRDDILPSLMSEFDSCEFKK